MQFWFNALCILTIFSVQLFGDEEKLIAGSCSRRPEPQSQPEPASTQQNEVCRDRTPRPMRVSVRYTTPRGIGYRPGYTTLEGFFSQVYQERWVPFLDVRGHVFDDGRLAANAGLGCRYLADTRVWGFNAYYDYRKMSHQHYNQAAAGVESLGKVWDFRLNGYLPVGKKQSHFRHLKFKEFSGHTMYVRARRDSALAGANLEAGVHVDHYEAAPFYFNAGPYYLHGKGVTTWGGQLRGAVDLCDQYLRLEANVSYDHFFRWIGQAQMSVNVSFGKRVRLRKSDCSCRCETALYARTEQRVDRNEIVPVARTHEFLAAIDPATDEPYFFVFVDNMSSSNGTFESPYPTLLLAQNNSSPRDIIYVFPGNGTSTGMNAGITLKDSQMLLGAGTKYKFNTTLGKVSIPPLAPIIPVLSNTGTTNPIVTLANNNRVSGLYIETINDAAEFGINGVGIANFIATDNRFIGGQGIIRGIVLTNISGQVVITDNLFSQFNAGGTHLAVTITQSTARCDVDFINNTFAHRSIGAPIGISLAMFGSGSMGVVNIDSNNFLGFCTGSGIVLNTNTNSTPLSNLIINNSNFNSLGTAILLIPDGNSFIENISVSNCTFQCNNSNAIQTLSGSAAIGTMTINNCDFLANNLSLNFISTIQVQNGLIANNRFIGNTNGSMLIGVGRPSSYAIRNNTFTGVSGILVGTPVSPGYAAQITSSAGSTLCLDFFHNTTVPTMDGLNVPYYFNGATGTFNITSESTQGNNIGTIQTNGTIGSCDQ
jgi:hypothetical protein